MQSKKTYQKILKRARKSLYRFPVEGMSEAQVFLFAGWLRLEEQAKAELCRKYRVTDKKSRKRRTTVGTPMLALPRQRYDRDEH